MKPATREESVQFSLKELLDLEDQRLAEQSRERAEREAAAARDLRSLEERKKHEQEERRRAEADEVAKREAMQKAVVEQARLEVEVRARGEERDRERRHELEIERLRTESARASAGTIQVEKSSIGALAGAALTGAVLMLAMMMGMHFGVVKPSADRHVAELAQSLSDEKAKAFDLGQQVEQERRTNAELRASLNKMQQAAGQAPPVEPGGKPTKPTGPTNKPTHPTPAPTKDLGPCVNEWDPLCGKIGH